MSLVPGSLMRPVSVVAEFSLTLVAATFCRVGATLFTITVVLFEPLSAMPDGLIEHLRHTEPAAPPSADVLRD